MKLAGGVHIVAAVVVCCCFSLGVCQNATDIYRGCYYDGDGSRSARVLADLITCTAVEGVCQASCGPDEAYCESDTGMTIDACKTLCRATNFQYYGVEAGSQCFCGGALSNPFYNGPVNMMANCSDPCTGNSSQTCGGDFTIEIYEFQVPVVDPGCFFPGSVPYAIVEDVGIGVGESITFRCEPGYELVGESELACISNRTWSSDVLPICNYTGVIAETTTEPPPTTTPARSTSTQETTTVVNPTTTVLATTKTETTTAEAIATTKSQTYRTTDMPIPATKQQTPEWDILPYVIAVSAVLVVLLVLGLICILTRSIRKQSGNATQNISLKPDDLAPVTLLNSGFTAGDDDTEAAICMPDILIDSDNRPKSAENEYANQGHQDQEMATFPRGVEGVKKGEDKFWDHPEGYAEMKAVEYPPNPIYEISDAATPNGATGPAESEYSTVGKPITDQGSSDGDDGAAQENKDYIDHDSGRKWNSKDTLISEDGRSFYADPATTSATKL